MRYIHSDRVSLSPTRIPSTTGYHLLPLRGSGKNSQNPAEAVVLLLRVRRCLPFSLEAFGPLLQDALRVSLHAATVRSVRRRTVQPQAAQITPSWLSSVSSSLPINALMTSDQLQPDCRRTPKHYWLFFFCAVFTIMRHV
jgi:hypothetical protein